MMNALTPRRGLLQAYVNKKKDAKDAAAWAKAHPISKMSNGVGWGGEPPMSKKIKKYHATRGLMK